MALDDAGRIVGHNRSAQLLLQAEHGSTVLGLPFAQLFSARFEDLGRFMRALPGERRALTLQRSGRVLFLHAVPPPSRWADAGAAAAPAAPEALPPALAALSGGDAALDRQLQRAARLVDTPVSVLVTGETGSGKEFFAKALHQAGQRRGKPFVAVNGAAIPETLIESELFGHLPGSFSGALARGKTGLIQEADGGTLFLDEIGDMPLALQARLLRVLAEREVLPVGATRAVPVNIRVIAATHADLEALVREGRFRDDLYYRLNGAHFVLPPLRERRDLGWMIDRLLRPQRDDDAPAPLLSAAARARLLAHAWPGNLRELRNVLDYARSVASDGEIGLADLPDALRPNERRSVDLSPALGDEAARLLQQLRLAHWNVSAVARAQGLSRMTLYRRMKRWGIASPNRLDDF